MTKSTDVLWIEMSRLARRLGRRMNVDSDDLVQNLAAAYLAQQHAVTEPGPWLERVARNLAVEAWRRQRREALASSSLPEASVAPTAWENLVAAQERRAITVAYQALPSDERALLAQRYGDPGLGVEAARPRSATERTRLRRVLMRLRHQLAALRALWAPGACTGVGQGMAALALGGQLAIVAVLGGGSGGTWDGEGAARRWRGTAAGDGAVSAPRSIVGLTSTASTRLAANEPARPPVSAPARPTPSREAMASGPARVASRSASVRSPASPATAGDPPPVQHMKYDDDEVEGELQNPDVIFVPGQTEEKKASLIELRRDFVPELLKGLEDVG